MHVHKGKVRMHIAVMILSDGPFVPLNKVLHIYDGILYSM